MNHQPRLSIIVPVYNEEQTLREIIQRIFDSCGNFAEVVFVDDGSKDNSLQILHDMARSHDTVIAKKNGGKGSAVRKGFAVAGGKYIVIQDADLEYDPEEIPEILEYAEMYDLDALWGSRRLKQQKQYVHLGHFLGGSLLTSICNSLYLSRLTDLPTCYKMVRGDILKTLPLKENDFRFDPELTVMLLRRGFTIAEQPISYHPRSMDEGKKVNWTDWFKWVWVFVSLRFRPRSYFWK
jgi:glycosyltransferase involved in cell wall biosynthesis